MAKISVSFGNHPYTLPIDKAELFYLGGCDALTELGLHGGVNELVDLVEVIRVYPNSGRGTNGQVVVEVVLSCGEKKRGRSFIVWPSNPQNRTYICNEIIQVTKSLARELGKELENQAKDFLDRLKAAEKQPMPAKP